MQTNIKNDVKSIQHITYEVYKLSGQALALIDNEDIDNEKLVNVLDNMSAQFEKSTIELRNLCENARPNVETGFKKLPALTIRTTGNVRVNEYGWLHIELNALLPHSRFQSSDYLTDTIVRLFDEYEHRGKSLPRFEQAVMVIDEHCDINSRKIYDQDNKGWKSVTNAIKGRAVIDDDQFTLGLALISTRSQTPACHIYLLPPYELSDFFYLKHTDGLN